MDLKSMLNGDAAAHKTPETPSQATFEQPIHTPLRNGSFHNPSEPSHRERPSPYPPPLRPPDQRTPSGSYFALQSTYQNNSASTTTSTWSAGAHAIHSQSPGTHAQPPHTPRDGFPPQQPYNNSFVPSPSPLAPQPPTPGAVQYHHSYPQSAHPSSHPPPSFGPPSIRETSLPPNGVRHVSPTAQFHPQPAAPLGPPAQFQRPSSQVHRPASQGYDHYRTYSSGSVGSTHSREIIPSHITSPQQLRRESLQRQYSMERERSISVSPKTIPRPSPYRKLSTESGRQSQVTPPVYYKPESEQSMSHSITAAEAQFEQQNAASTPQSASHTPKETRVTPMTNSARPSPAPTSQTLTPKSTHTSLPASQSPQVQKQGTLKRNASLVSGVSISSQPARKRPRRDEMPIFAQSARPGRPPRLKRSSARSVAVSAPIKAEHPINVRQVSNGDTSIAALSQPATMPATMPAATQATPRWEPSITNIVPYEDLTRRVCDWIAGSIGQAEPPSGGAMFEIEAKIGEIFDAEMGVRIQLPVETEAVFNKDRYRRTKFESSMNMEQHKQLNAFLNNLVQESHAQSLTSDRTPIYFDHPREFDEFFELTAAGIANLPPCIKQWLNPRHKPRVRKTIDLKTNKVKAQIIKSRIADLEIYNPGSDFDYRISISIESPWQGEQGWLDPLTNGGRERNKDRMSYRHMAYQIDLTQVTYSSKQDKEHELEVEISTEQIRKELDNLANQRESKYEDLIRGFLDNVRILCRKGTVPRR